MCLCAFALACALANVCEKWPYLRRNGPTIVFRASGAQFHTMRQKCEIRAILGNFGRHGILVVEKCHLCPRFLAMATDNFTASIYRDKSGKIWDIKELITSVQTLR